MINHIKEKHKKYFYPIPLKLPTIIISLIILAFISYLVIGPAEGFFINLITELFGILVTIYIVSYLLLNEEKKQWDSIESIINNKLKVFIFGFYYTILNEIDINPYEQTEEEYDYNKTIESSGLKSLIDKKLADSMIYFTGKRLDNFVRSFTKEKEELSKIILYMEKRPLFLHKILIYEVEYKMESLITGYQFKRILSQFNDQTIFMKTKPEFIKKFIFDVEDIVNKVETINDSLKSCL